MKQLTKEQRDEKVRYLLEKKTPYTFDDLVTVVELLRSEGGCPWDMEQDHKSIRNDLIEETYEVIEAIDTEDPVLLREELGDVLLQVVFHARIEQEQDVFGMEEVSNDICAKLIHRHPHVFGTVEVANSDEVLKNWDAIKGEEKQRITMTDKLRAIPPMYPALMRAQKVGKKAACFDFGSAEEVYAKLDEEIAEVKAAAAEGNPEAVAEELGDLLLTVTSLARKLGVKSEEALFHATNKFIDRFEQVEQAVLEQGGDMESMTMPQLDAIWDSIKHRK
jgi:tetrapyrrole methylase family protein/MazG family protein